jgi:hypothetical protein
VQLKQPKNQFARWVEPTIRRGGFSKQRRRAAAESGHIRLLPRTKGSTPSNRVCYCTPEEHRRLDTLRFAYCQLEPNHLVSHLILKIRNSKNFAELEPRYGIEP